MEFQSGIGSLNIYIFIQIPISRTISVFVEVLKSNIKEFKSVNGVESR